ncbi:MAG: hypothetical protein H0V01_04280 [Bacteroidetes bacterium]|nr:hypothetical protein [Bacteroidota bacterium]HET6245323.1 hypothetical protein [Bacteroidia bacterium]
MKRNLFQVTTTLFTRKNIFDLFKVLIIGILVIIGTFPENDFTMSIGIDPPLFWVYNHLFANGLSLGKNIIFPHGPLAFFMYPLHENILIASAALTLLKIILVLNLVKLVDYKGNDKWLIALISAYFISIIASFNHLILANVILFYANYYQSENSGFKIGAFVLTAFALYIKSYVAVISGIICFSFLSYYLFTRRNYKKLLFDILSILGMMVSIWLIMYGTFKGFISYGIGMFHLAQDNSSAASFYPYNNWWVLSLFLAITFGLPFLFKSKKSIFYGVLFSLSLFAAWKHGMSREDIYHVNDFLIYLLIGMLVFILFSKENTVKHIALALLGVFLFYFNMTHALNYKSFNYELIRSNNFIEFVSDYSSIKSKAEKKSIENIAGNRLPSFIADSIHTKTVDVYPWDYSIIAANNLNWQPRPVIQSYAAYTTWLDKQNADHFISEKAPDWLIWELNKLTKDINGGNLNSIDNRYLLNDEPQTILQILSSYEPYYNDAKFLLYKKRDKQLETNKSILSKDKLKWGNWLQVPEATGGLLRAKLDFEKSILQSVKSFLYKDEQFWVYLKLSNGLIHKYRIVPKNAKDGIWINPYIFNPSNKVKDAHVEEIMFKCSNQDIINTDVSIEWEQIDFKNEPDYALRFFNKAEKNQDTVYVSSVINFRDNSSRALNVSMNNQKIKFDDFESSQNLPANSYSGSFSIMLDSIPNGDLTIESDLWIKAENYNYSRDLIFIISIENPKGSRIWEGIAVDEQLIDNKHWSNIFNSVVYKHNDPGCFLSIYLWNTSKNEATIDNFRIRITKKQYFF